MKKLLLTGAVSLFLVGCATQEQPAEDPADTTDPATEETTEMDTGAEVDTEAE